MNFHRLNIGVRAKILVAAALLMSGSPSSAQLATEQTVVPVAGGQTGKDALARAQQGLEQNGVRGAVDPSATNTQLLSIPAGSAGPGMVKAVSIPSQDLSAAAKRLDALVVGDRHQAPSALPEIRDTFRKDPVPGFAVKSDTSTTTTVDLNLSKSMAAAVKRADAVGIHINASELLRLPGTARLRQATQANQGMASFSQSYQSLISQVATALRRPDQNTNAQLREGARMTRESFIESWPSLVDKPADRQLAVQSLDGLSHQPELKAVYEQDTSFEPQSYQTIFHNSARLAVLMRADGQLLCSGVLVSEQWILTAGHCLVDDLAGLRIRISQQDGTLGPARAIARRWPENGTGAQGSDPIDYIFLEMAPGRTTSLPDLKPLCIRVRDIDFQEPVIAIGFARDKELVYDDAFVWYPYRLLPTAYSRVQAGTGARRQRMAQANPDPEPRKEEFFQREYKSFLAAYAATAGSGGSLAHLYRARTEGVSVDRPRFGFDTDTSHGDSGAPVFSRRDSCIVGVVAGGIQDDLTVEQANWLLHEFGTPITEIVADVGRRRAAPNSQLDPSLQPLFAAWDSAIQPDP